MFVINHKPMFGQYSFYVILLVHRQTDAASGDTYIHLLEKSKYFVNMLKCVIVWQDTARCVDGFLAKCFKLSFPF